MALPGAVDFRVRLNREYCTLHSSLEQREPTVDLNLNGAIVLVTGGSKGIGLACASAFAAEGARVAICSRSQDHIDQAKAKLPEAFGITADLTDSESAAATIEAIENKLGPIAVLVNSAGAAKRTPPDELTPASWRAAMDAKYFSYINVIDPLAKRMARRGKGVIVNIIGAGGKVASPTHLAGGAANAALMLATAGLANAYAGRGVRVVGVNPGLTRGFRQFLLRGVEKVRAEWAMICTAHNLRKLFKHATIAKAA
jgi:NAD(P)-dependent dehydrogenase (short-subunit alcohol dehydrogenase family)